MCILLYVWESVSACLYYELSYWLIFIGISYLLTFGEGPEKGTIPQYVRDCFPSTLVLNHRTKLKIKYLHLCIFINTKIQELSPTSPFWKLLISLLPESSDQFFMTRSCWHIFFYKRKLNLVYPDWTGEGNNVDVFKIWIIQIVRDKQLKSLNGLFTRQ